jgi:predicted protein tyrosine phosphatase
MTAPKKPQSVYVLSKKQAELLLRSRDTWDVTGFVSIGSPKGSLPKGWDKISPKRKLRLEFDDLTHVHHESYGFRACYPSDIEELLAFGKKRNAGKLVIHCAAGVSRSSAAALILLVQRLGNIDEAYSRLLCDVEAAVRLGLRADEEIAPNRRMIHLADKLLGKKGNLLGLNKYYLGDAYSTTYLGED